MGRKKPRPPAAPEPAGAAPAAFLVLFALWCAWLLWKTYAGSGPMLAQGLSFFALPRYAGAARVVPLARLAGAYALDLLTLAALALAADGFGRPLLRPLPAPPAGWERFLLAQGAGLGALALATLALGLAGFANAGASLALAGIGLALSSWRLVRAPVAAPRSPEEPSAWSRLSALEWLLLGCLGYAAALQLVEAFAPETFFDSFVYHLAAPQQYLARGRIERLGSLHSDFPQNMELLYLLALALRGERVASLVHAWAWALTVAGIIGAGKAAGSRSAGLAAAALFAAIPVAAAAAWHTGVELGVAFWQLLGAWCLLRGFRRAEEADGGPDAARWLAGSGAFYGLAMGAKYTALWGAAAAGVCLALWLSRRPEPRAMRLRWAGLWACAALAALSPWLLKNLLLAGNPVAPFLPELFGDAPGAARDLEAFRASARGHFWYGGALAWRTWLLGPWRIFAEGRSAFSFLGPVFLLFLPLAARAGRAGFPLGWLLALFGVEYALWASSSGMVRLLIPALPFFCLYAARQLEQLGRPWPWLVLAPTAWGLAWCAAMVNERESAAPAFGYEHAEDFLERQHHGYFHPYAALARKASAALPPDARLLVVGDSRGYGFARPAEAASVFDPDPLLEAVRAAPDAAAAAAALRSRGFTHLFVNHGEVYRIMRPKLHALGPEGLGRLARLFSEQTTLIERSPGGAALYALAPPAAPDPALPEIVRLALDGHPRAADFIAPTKGR